METYSVGGIDVSLPVPRWKHGRLNLHRQTGHPIDLLAIGNAPVIFAP